MGDLQRIKSMPLLAKNKASPLPLLYHEMAQTAADKAQLETATQQRFEEELDISLLDNQQGSNQRPPQ